ncbi:hypothetical protein GN958_ATG12035 [Phytophthora infestans]|uniref:Uncharacterized protein n=1 Tax=Phytophthora infestans TaxID=4787 RepID=A0A8S9UE02_PHYIN|nr:hypothetical protein GN958_ATG12035 [Phytophthora infestans]
MASSPADAYDSQLWAVVRCFSDADLRHVQSSIRQFHCADESALYSGLESPSSASNFAISLQLGGETQRVRVDDFVHVFLDFLHRQVQLHADARVSSDTATQDTSSANMAASDNNMATVATFDEEFPQLTSSAAAKTTKRRITTTLLTPKNSTVVTRPVPAAISFPPLGASETTRPPAWAKHSLLEKRMGAAAAPSAWGSQSSVHATAPVPAPVIAKKESTQGPLAVTKMATLRPQQLQVRTKSPSNQVTHKQREAPKHKSRVQLTSPRTRAKAAASDFQVNTQAAKLLGFLIRERFVKSTCAELQVLVGLLYRADCTSCSSQDNSLKSEFCWRTHCLDFAEIVFLEIESVLKHLGADLLGLIKQSLRDAEGICQDLLERLELASRRREELRVAESARVGCQLPVEVKASAVRDFALPFNEETDSRLHYRTPAESLLYTNREKVRDGFLSLLRQFQLQQHSLVGIENAGVAAAAIAAARELLTDVSPENRWWFAKFFVQELVQVGSNPFGESDNDLVLKIMEDKLVVKNPDRLRKLHRRFSSQKPATKSPQISSSSGSRNPGKASGKGSNSNSKSRQDESDATRQFTATLEQMKRYFTDNQLFFFHFLHSCDSYEISELVKHQLERQFYAIREADSASTDARKNFTEVVLRLKVVAKFLGYLRFSPQWQVTSSIRKLSAQNAAIQAVEREGISTLQVARNASLDVKKLLEDSIRTVAISKCLPWLSDYLSMLSLDRLSLGTTYFKQLVVLLQLLYRSPRLDSLGETGLYMAIQIERIFLVLRLEDGFIRGSAYQSRDLLPSPEIRDALARDDEALDAGEDRLPFLYSQVFVQSCVSELEDLRGFLQTRAQPTRRRKLSIGSGSTTAGQPATPIRKLRPLQVVIEDDSGAQTASSFALQHGDRAVKLPLSSSPPVQDESDHLADAVFKVHPKLKATVEFVVGNVTTDVCEHVVTRVVTSRADVLVDRCASESGLLAGRANPTSASTEDAAFAARASFQMLITSQTRHEANAAVVAALDEALRLAEERVSAAVPPLMPPWSHPTLIHSVVFVARQRTRTALKTLVPRSAQTAFVKRVAFRNKTLLKDLGAASKTAALSPTPPSEAGHVRELRRLSAQVSTSAGHQSITSLADWEAQTSRLLQCVAQFTSSFKDGVAAGVLVASPVALVLWDVVWRAVTSCVKFLGASLDVFAACELLSMREDRVEAVERTHVELVAALSTLLEVVVCSVPVDDDVAASRLQCMITAVMELMSKRLAAGSKGDVLVERFAVRTSSVLAAKLRAIVPKSVELDWNRWTDATALKSEGRGGWDAATKAPTAAV